MTHRLIATVSALAFAFAVAAPVQAQHQHHPAPAQAKPAAKKPAKKPAVNKPVKKKPTAKKAPAKKPPSKKAAAKKPAPAKAPRGQPMDPHSGHEAPSVPAAPAAPGPVDHSQMHHGEAAPEQASPPAGAPAHADHSKVGHHPAPADGHAAHEAMAGAVGPYVLNRESSGTAWQPDTSEHSALHVTSGDWTLMGHGTLNLVYDHQGGPRGADKVFPSGMLMGMARRPLGNGTLQFKAMLSPDPIMGKRGYPLLLASGETANGVDPLIDRQHPHDFFMELAGSISQNIGPKSSVFLYAGLPGEPAFGPPAFMHREAILDSPEAPISHHWLDSTHITFGVVTAGLVLDRFKVEASRFNGREPDEHRWNIETGPLDSTSIRVSWNPTRTLSLQGSWGHFEEPEQLEPGNQKRWSASALWADEVAPGWKLAGTLAWGRKSIDEHGEWLDDDAYVAEASLKHRAWTLFGRAELTENRELAADDHHGEAHRVGKASLGVVRDVRIAEHLSFGAGALVSVNFVPDELAPFYGGSKPMGAMGFLRVKLD